MPLSRTNLKIEVHEESQVGEVRRMVTQMCQLMESGDEAAGRGAILATEMARNVVRHGGGGEMLLRALNTPTGRAVELLALDRGPGMANVAECLRDGYSTAGTPGTGLGAIKRMAEQVEIFSSPKRGTVIRAVVGPSGRPLPAENGRKFIHGGISVPVRGETICGDAWEALESPERFRLLVADGLGHGPLACQAATEAVKVFQQYPEAPLDEYLELAHQALQKTRGAAASIAEIHLASGQLTTAGLGNVSMRLLANHVIKSLAGDNGTLGASLRRAHQFIQPWVPGSTLILHSDGVATHWNLDDYPGLTQRHPTLIAAVLYRDFHRHRDDATVVVVRGG